MIILQADFFGIIFLYILLKVFIKSQEFKLNDFIVDEVSSNHDDKATELEPTELLPADGQFESPDN